MNPNTTVDTEKVVQEYRHADTAGRSLLETIFGKELFTHDEWKDMFRDFCKENNLNYATIVGDDLPDDEQAYQMIKALVKQANVGCKDTGKYWSPWFNLVVPSGFGFSGTDYAYSRTCTNVGSRLRYWDEGVCTSTVKKYLPIYRKFITE